MSGKSQESSTRVVLKVWVELSENESAGEPLRLSNEGETEEGMKNERSNQDLNLSSEMHLSGRRGGQRR